MRRLLCLLILLVGLWAQSAFAQVTISGTPHTFTDTAGIASPHTEDSYTPEAGDVDRMVIIFVGAGSNSADFNATAMTLGGQAMTEIGSTATDGAFVMLDAFRLLESGIDAMSGATISVTFSGTAAQLSIIAFTLDGVHQTTPITSIQSGASASATTAQSSASVTSTSGGMVIGGLMSDSEGINTSTAHSHTSIVYSAVMSGDTIGAAQWTAGTGGSINLTWTQAATGSAVKTFSVDQAAAGAASAPKGMLLGVGP